MHQVNDIFEMATYKLKNPVKYVIKGAWDDECPNDDVAWLMRLDGTGHAYAGKVTKVKSVWNITDNEFAKMCAFRPYWFVKVDKKFDTSPKPINSALSIKHTYIEKALRTEYPTYKPMKKRLQKTKTLRLLHAAILMSSECGELFQNALLADSKNVMLDIPNIIEELGDICWGLAQTFSILDTSFPTKIQKSDSIIKSTKGVETKATLSAIGTLTIRTSTFLDHMKRCIYYGTAFDYTLIQNECYQILAICNIISDIYTIPFVVVLKKNIDKLKKRYPGKYSDNQAIHRNLKNERKTLEA